MCVLYERAYITGRKENPTFPEKIVGKKFEIFCLLRMLSRSIACVLLVKDHTSQNDIGNMKTHKNFKSLKEIKEWTLENNIVTEKRAYTKVN